MAACRGLLIDWGGVLTSSIFDSFAAFCTAEGLREDAVKDAFAGSPAAGRLLADFESGRMEDAEFERRFGALLEVRETEGLIPRLFGAMRPDREMQEAVAAFRAAGIRTGLLSNSWGTRTYDRARFDALFDVLVISGELGVRKPEPEIYAIAAERMDLAPAELVFVDDLPGNLKPARALGMATVVHRDAASTVAELERLLGVRVGAGS